MELKSAMHHDGAENEVAVMAEDAFGGEAERKIVAGDLAHGQNVEDSGVDEQIDDEDGEEAGKDGAGNEVAGILDFIAEIDDAVPAVVSVDGGLNAEKKSGDEKRADGDGDGGGSWASGRLRQPDEMPPKEKQATTMTKKTRPFRTVVKFCTLLPMLMLFHCSKAKRMMTETAVILIRSDAVQRREKMRACIRRRRCRRRRWCRRWRSSRSSQQ